MIWVGGGATTPVTSTVSGEDYSGTPLTLTTYTNDLASGQIPYAFSWAQAGTGVGPDIARMTATLSSFGESGAILATFYTGVLSSFPRDNVRPGSQPGEPCCYHPGEGRTALNGYLLQYRRNRKRQHRDQC